MFTKNSTNKGTTWLFNEVCALLDIWMDDEIQQQLAGRLHNMCVYEKISKQLFELGILRTGEQCREKIKKLRRDYKTIVENNYSAAFACKIIGYYDKVKEAFSKYPVAKTKPKSNGSNKIHQLSAKAKIINDVPANSLTEDVNKISHRFKLNVKDLSDINNNFKKHRLELLKHQTEKHNEFISHEKTRYHNELLRQEKRFIYIETRRKEAKQKRLELLEAILDRSLR